MLNFNPAGVAGTGTQLLSVTSWMLSSLGTILHVQQVVDSTTATAFQSTEMLLGHEPAWKGGAQGIAVPQD